MNKKVDIIKGGKAISDSWSIKFVNDFSFKNVQRFYHIEIEKRNVIRAFHGHMVEEKYAYVTKGKFLLVAIKIDDKKNPSKKTEINKIILSSNNPQIVHIPKGYANGYKSLQNRSSIIFYSTLALKDSEKDDFRFDENYWGENVWNEHK